jgi:hypothetical protein
MLPEVRLEFIGFMLPNTYSDIGSTFLQQTLSTGYPKFLRLFHEFFAKIAVHTDTIYVHTQQRSVNLITSN